MSNRKTLLSLVFAGVLLLSACNLPSSQKATETSPDTVNTAAALTVEALQTQLAPQATAPAQVVVITNTPAPTQTQVPTATTAPTLPPPPTSTPIPCDRGSFVSDVNVPDGTVFTPSTSFTKTWRLKNIGSCTWSTSYKLVFSSGDAMSGPATQALPGPVGPGETIDVSVTLKSPAAANDYRGDWKLQNASGVNFGLGTSGTGTFYVKISVKSSQPAFAITNVVVTVGTQPSGCPKVIPFAGVITSTSAGHVTYYWELDGVKGATQAVDFTGSGNQTVAVNETVNAAGAHQIRFYVDNPNHQYFGDTNFNVTCP